MEECAKFRLGEVCVLCCDISECVSGRFCQFAFANAFPGGTKSLPEQMLTYRKSCGIHSVATSPGNTEDMIP